MLNPLSTHLIKKQATRKVKTDPIDAVRIANAYYLGEGSPYNELHDEIAELRFLCRQYTSWVSLLTEVQLQFRAVLELAFPGFDKAFQNPLSPSSLQILSHFPSPSSLLQANKEVVLQHLMLNRRGRLWNEKKYEKLIYIAQHSLPDPCGAIAHHFAILQYIQLIQSYKTSLSALALQMENRTEHAYPYQLLRSIPGVGPITAATVSGISKQIHGPRNLILFQFY